MTDFSENDFWVLCGLGSGGGMLGALLADYLSSIGIRILIVDLIPGIGFLIGMSLFLGIFKDNVGFWLKKNSYDEII